MRTYMDILIYVFITPGGDNKKFPDIYLKEVMFLPAFICYKRILREFLGNVHNGTKNSWLHFGDTSDCRFGCKS